MLTFLADIRVLPRRGIREPQGATIEPHLEAAIGEHTITSVTVGKLIRLQLEAESLKAATAQVQLACDKILVNPVIQRYEMDIREVDS